MQRVRRAKHFSPLIALNVLLKKTCSEPHMHFVLMLAPFDSVCIEIFYSVIHWWKQGKGREKSNEIIKILEQKGKRLMKFLRLRCEILAHNLSFRIKRQILKEIRWSNGVWYDFLAIVYFRLNLGKWELLEKLSIFESWKWFSENQFDITKLNAIF